MTDITAARIDSPLAILDRLDSSAQRVNTPCGDGSMVWRSWGSGPPLVLLHGGAGSWRHWARNIDAFAPIRRVLAPDLPGLGESAEQPPPTTIAGTAEIVALGIDKILGPHAQYDLTGFSYGGVVSGGVSELHGARLRSLTVVGSNRLGLGRKRPELVRVRHLEGEERRAAHRFNLASLMIADPAKVDELALAIQEINTKPARIASHHVAVNDSLYVSISKLPASVRLNGIYGEADVSAVGTPMTDKEAVFRKLRPDVNFRIIPGAGHWVAFEAADEFNAILRDMLK